MIVSEVLGRNVVMKKAMNLELGTPLSGISVVSLKRRQLRVCLAVRYQTYSLWGRVASCRPQSRAGMNVCKGGEYPLPFTSCMFIGETCTGVYNPRCAGVLKSKHVWLRVVCVEEKGTKDCTRLTIYLHVYIHKR